jgi:hypothetical protein
MGGQIMSRRGASIDLKDVQEMTDRVMIDLFKQRIQEMDLYPEQLKGTWSEASSILAKHFGKVSRIMSLNRGRLHDLYKSALKELEKV